MKKIELFLPGFLSPNRDNNPKDKTQTPGDQLRQTIAEQVQLKQQLNTLTVELGRATKKLKKLEDIKPVRNDNGKANMVAAQNQVIDGLQQKIRDVKARIK